MNQIEFEINCDPTQPRKIVLKERTWKFGTVFEPARDHIEVIPKSQWDEIADAQQKAKASLRSIVWGVLDQNGRGSCAQEQAGSAMMLVREFQGLPRVKPNPWPNYFLATGGRDNGSSIDSAYRIGKERGWIPQSLLARKGSFKRQPQSLWDEAQKYRFDEIYDVDGVVEFVSCLLQGFPVGYGRRGHAILAVEYLGRGKFKMQNSWGNWTDCGDPGFGSENTSRDINRGYGMFALRTTRVADELPEKSLQGAV